MRARWSDVSENSQFRRFKLLEYWLWQRLLQHPDSSSDAPTKTHIIVFCHDTAQIYIGFIMNFSFLTRKKKEVEILALRRGEATCQIYRFGAHIASWVVDGEEKLWLSSLSQTDGSAPMLRGGIQISFPHYENHHRPKSDDGTDDGDDWKVQSLARQSRWEIHRHTEHRAVLRLRDDKETNMIWPHRFLLEYTIDLLENGLEINLKVSNTGPLDSAFSFTAGIPTYLRFDNTERVVLLGFKKTTYIDKVDGGKEKIQMGPVNMHTEALRTSRDAQLEGYVDRIYRNSPKELEFHNLVKRQTLFKISQSESWPDTTLYNPWLGDKQGADGPDFDDDGFLYMICCEPTITKTDAVTVRPGDGSWQGSMTILVPP
jgi:D-hexose-6-phosphate mutarotase